MKIWRTPAGEVIVDVYNSGNDALNRMSTTRMVLTYDNADGYLSENRCVYEPGSSAPSVAVKTTVNGNGLTIEATSDSENQIAKYADGIPTGLSLRLGASDGSAGKFVEYSFDALGKIAGVKLDGVDLKGTQANEFVHAGEATLRTIARENGLPMPAELPKVAQMVPCRQANIF